MQIYILYNGRTKSWIEINMQTKELIEAKRIQEIAVDFKGMSIFCFTIHWFFAVGLANFACIIKRVIFRVEK